MWSLGALVGMMAVVVGGAVGPVGVKITVQGGRRIVLVAPGGRRLVVDAEKVVRNELRGVSTDVLYESDRDETTRLAKANVIRIGAVYGGVWTLRVMPRSKSGVSVSVGGRVNGREACSTDDVIRECPRGGCGWRLNIGRVGSDSCSLSLARVGGSKSVQAR
jgi:hypothetical protein